MWAQAVLGQMLCPDAERQEMQNLNILCCEQLPKIPRKLNTSEFYVRVRIEKKRLNCLYVLYHHQNYIIIVITDIFHSKNSLPGFFFHVFFLFKISPACSCHALKHWWCWMGWNVSCGPLETNVMATLSAARGVWSTETCQQKQVNRIEQGKKNQ